jgi:hypothetical protein
MLNQIYGKENLEDFGVYVTADNVDEQIKERERRFYALLAEYGETGEIQLGKAYDESYLMDALIFPALSNMFVPQTSLLFVGEYLYMTQRFYAGFGRLRGAGNGKRDFADFNAWNCVYACVEKTTQRAGLFCS